MPHNRLASLEAELESALGEMETEAGTYGYRQSETESEFSRNLDLAAHELEQGAESFVTKVLPGLDEGHEVLTRFAAVGLVSGADRDSVMLGVIRPDRGGASYWNFPGSIPSAFDPRVQPAHSLRPTAATTTPAALALIRDRLASLYRAALSAPGRSTALEYVGEGLHLIQDSYSGAHVERAPASGGISRIVRIRAFYINSWPPSRSTAPSEHNVPSDSRDQIWDPVVPTRLRNEAILAVAASREYLEMLLRHLAAPTVPTTTAEFNAFLNRHLV